MKFSNIALAAIAIAAMPATLVAGDDQGIPVPASGQKNATVTATELSDVECRYVLCIEHDDRAERGTTGVHS